MIASGPQRITVAPLRTLAWVWMLAGTVFAMGPHEHTVSTSLGHVAFSWRLRSHTPVLQTGVFVDGQPWIVAPPDGLWLVSATPYRQTLTVQDRSGSEIVAEVDMTVINPPAGDVYERLDFDPKPRLAPLGNAFGWDSRGAIRYGTGRRYNPALPWDRFTAARLYPGDVVTTARSFRDLAFQVNGQTQYRESVLVALAVLTVLGAPPPADAFRPGVVRHPDRRASPEFFRLADIRPDLDQHLISFPATDLFGASLPFVPGAAPPEFQAARLTGLFPGPGFMNIGFDDARGTNAWINNSGTSYSADISMTLGDLAIGALAAWLTPEQRQTCRIRFLQRCIDVYESVLAGLCLSFNGGKMTGYGLRMQLAGNMLNHAGMKAMDQSVHGLYPGYFFSEYAQWFYLGDPERPVHGAPAPGHPRFIPWNSTDAELRLDDIPVFRAGADFVEVDLLWPVYRAARAIPNLKFRIASGPGAGGQVYTIREIRHYWNPVDGRPGIESDPVIRRGMLYFTPAWRHGPPTDGSTLSFFPATREESNRWLFNAQGMYNENRWVDFNRKQITLSPTEDYASVNIGAHLSMVIALYALGADRHFTAGLDKWMIDIGRRAGEGELAFNSARSRHIAEPVFRSWDPSHAFLGGLWREQVLDRVGAPFVYTGQGQNALPPRLGPRLLMGRDANNGLPVLLFEGWNPEGYLLRSRTTLADQHGWQHEATLLNVNGSASFSPPPRPDDNTRFWRLIER